MRHFALIGITIAVVLIVAGLSLSHQQATEREGDGGGEPASESDFAPGQAAPPRLIVRGDDMGYSHSGNEAILKCYKEGIETSIEVIVPSPWFPEAVAMLAQIPKADVGVHLALTSEWDNVKWRPVSDCPSLRDADGYFHPMIYPNKNYPKRALLEQRWRLEDIEKEFRAQIELALKKIPRVSHLSGHMGCDHIHADVRALVDRLAVEYKLDIAPAKSGVKGISYVGPHATSEEKIGSFLKALESLEPGKTYLFVDHPGLDSPELRAIHHIGYENVAVDRQGVTDTWTDPRIRDFIKAKGIQLIGYIDLKKSAR
jgi:chitin disaccharide deacetylase